MCCLTVNLINFSVQFIYLSYDFCETPHFDKNNLPSELVGSISIARDDVAGKMGVAIEPVADDSWISCEIVPKGPKIIFSYDLMKYGFTCIKQPW